MKKYLKSLIILFISIVLTGYTWKDFEDDYSELIPNAQKDNIECVYEGNSDVTKIAHIKYLIQGDSFSVKYDGGSSHTLFHSRNPKEETFEISDNNGYVHHYDAFSFETFFSYLKRDKKCMSNIYICYDNYNDIYDRTDNNSGTYGTMTCYSYQNVSNTSNPTSRPKASSDGRTCSNVNATSCEHYQDSDIEKRKIYIEVGVDDKGNYFGISYDSFATIILSKGLDHLTSLYNDNFYINDNNVFSQSGKYLDKIYLSYITNQGITSYYLQSAKSSSTGDFWLDDFNNPNSGTGTGASGTPGSTVDPKPSAPRMDYTSLCSGNTAANKGIRSAAKIIGYVIAIGKWIGPLLIIIFGMIDFVKAVISSDDKALNKATNSLIMRIVAGIMVIVVPIAAKAILHVVIDTKGIDSTSDSESSYAACTRCILDPFNDCDTN